AAMPLSLDDHVVDEAADVVAAREARDAHLTRLAIDLHFARLHAIRPRWRRRCLGRRHPEELARLSCGELAERDRAIGPRDAKAPVAVLEVGRRRFQRLGRERLALADYPPARGDHGRAADEGRARANAADAVRPVGVSLYDAHLVRRYAEHLRH